MLYSRVHNKRKGPRQACLSYDQESPDIASECKLCIVLQLKCLLTRTVNCIMWHNLLFSYHTKFIPVMFLISEYIFNFLPHPKSLLFYVVLRTFQTSMRKTHSFQKLWHCVQRSLRLQFSISNFLMYHKVISLSWTLM